MSRTAWQYVCSGTRMGAARKKGASVLRHIHATCLLMTTPSWHARGTIEGANTSRAAVLEVEGGTLGDDSPNSDVVAGQLVYVFLDRITMFYNLYHRWY